LAQVLHLCDVKLIGIIGWVGEDAYGSLSDL